MSQTSIETVRKLTEIASTMTQSRVLKYPKYGVYIHAQEQIGYIRSILDSNRIPTNEEKARIDIGLMAVRELEDEEPEYATALIGLAARFNEL